MNVKTIATYAIVIGLMITAASVGMSLAFAASEKTYTSSYLTVSETTDNETVAVAFEVQYSYRGLHDKGENHEAMGQMNEAAICAEQHITSYVTTHTADDAMHADFREVVVTCATSHITVKSEVLSDYPTN